MATDPKALAERLREQQEFAIGELFDLVGEAADALEALSVQPHAGAVVDRYIEAAEQAEIAWANKSEFELRDQATAIRAALRNVRDDISVLYATPPAAQPQEGDQKETSHEVEELHESSDARRIR